MIINIEYSGFESELDKILEVLNRELPEYDGAVLTLDSSSGFISFLDSEHEIIDSGVVLSRLKKALQPEFPSLLLHIDEDSDE